jgi:hypothetical protein
VNELRVARRPHPLQPMAVGGQQAKRHRLCPSIVEQLLDNRIADWLGVSAADSSCASCARDCSRSRSRRSASPCRTAATRPAASCGDEHRHQNDDRDEGTASPPAGQAPAGSFSEWGRAPGPSCS